MEIRIIGNQSPELIRRMLDNAGLDRHNYEAVGRLVAQHIGMIFCALNSGHDVTLCFTAPVHINNYLDEKLKKACIE